MGVALKWQIKSLAKLAHPSDLLGGYTGDEGVWFNVAVDDCASSYKGVLTYSDAAHHRAVGAQGYTTFDQGVAWLDEEPVE